MLAALRKELQFFEVNNGDSKPSFNLVDSITYILYHIDESITDTC